MALPREPRIGVDVHSSACVDDDGKVECVCGLDDDRDAAFDAEMEDRREFERRLP